MPDTSSESKVCLARQPILNLNESIIAYEMLFRQINATDANVIDGTAATADVIMNLFNNMGLSSVIGNKKAFINFNEYFIQNDIINILPKDRVVLEILENVTVDDKLFSLLKSLVQAGFSLAIDDFIDNDSTQKLFEIVKIMKIDISDYSSEQLLEYVKLGQQHKLTLLAERVETKEEFLMCKEMGFELYQGYFFAKPEYIEQQAIPSNKAAIINILNDIMANNDIADIERKISQDVSISYKLLRYINSAGLRRDTKIESIRAVIQLLGVKPLYRWLSLFLFTNDNGNNDSSLFVTALTRAFFLEYIAKQVNQKIANDLFILGIFSYLDTLLKMPFSEALKDISIPENIKTALLEQSGPYNDYYQLSLLIDTDNFNELATILNSLNLVESQITEAHLYAMQTANSLL
ncbi:Predicted signal transduction protein [hydrothermal vent metagenome]|uniref:Predicted signal transduction protein n=1 Tax=hydrothermal vent metagenome TaxID=652676 RepID=A0A3B0ZDK8_9ZZZZ